MPMLLRKLNYRNIILCRERSTDAVGVLLRSGEIRYFNWLGFVERAQARHIGNGIPVKLEIAAYSMNDDMPAHWIDLDIAGGQMIQGCHIGSGVHAVMEDGVPRVVKKS